MKFTVRDRFLLDENENIVATIMQGTPLIIENILEAAPELAELSKEFVEGVNSGTFKPKTTVNKFETILGKHNLL